MAASAVKRLFGAGEGAADVVVPIAQQSIAGPAVECEAEAPYLAGTDGAAPPPIMIGGSTATVKSAVTAEELAGPEELAATSSGGFAVLNRLARGGSRRNSNSPHQIAPS